MEKCTLRGLIKPIPKQLSCSLLKHWRPTTMMLVIYKIAAKLVTNRLSPNLNKVIILHQHGFIKGRSIYENILAAMIGIDYAKVN